ncbi:hypothetical protein [Hymenobacter jeollabukensis]|uniref:Uncharacterized protein n=1 Tax=Hymenobacter jeollabukensis TaxID=2025313 RepID=A0A5R8WJ35_9BACT|nr:hypothetical protein [Hymenobacter jeollabukensis]TLM88905.1 hypothetical protein FDY95_22240 [Hymenobacter jeollabukensis]
MTPTSHEPKPDKRRKYDDAFKAEALRDYLCQLDYRVNEKRVRRLMRLMAQEPIYFKSRLSAPGEGVTRCPYLLQARVLTAPMRSEAPTSPVF